MKQSLIPINNTNRSMYTRLCDGIIYCDETYYNGTKHTPDGPFGLFVHSYQTIEPILIVLEQWHKYISSNIK